jgi:hypothetical protein
MSTKNNPAEEMLESIGFEADAEDLFDHAENLALFSLTVSRLGSALRKELRKIAEKQGDNQIRKHHSVDQLMAASAALLNLSERLHGEEAE